MLQVHVPLTAIKGIPLPSCPSQVARTCTPSPHQRRPPDLERPLREPLNFKIHLNKRAASQDTFLQCDSTLMHDQ